MVAIVHEAKAEGYSNAGSVYDLTSYLDKEKECSVGFFNHEKEQISPSEVILSIDQNHTKLGRNDPKFFMLTLNPSHEELCSVIGRSVNSRHELTEEEKVKIETYLKGLTKKAMDTYADQFQRHTVRSAEDLLYYARIEAKRIYKPTHDNIDAGCSIGQEKDQLNYHVHVIVSRKSKDGKVKLSPRTDSKGNEWYLDGKGIVRRGFNREAWTREVQLEWYRMIGKQAEADSIQRQTDSIARCTNADMKELADYKFTKASFVLEEMKERGYDIRYAGRDLLLSKDKEQFLISAKDLRLRETHRLDKEEWLEAWRGTQKEDGYDVKSFDFEVKDKETQEKKTITERYIRSSEHKVLLGYKECTFEASKHLSREELIDKLPEEVRPIFRDSDVFNASERIVQLEQAGYKHEFNKVHIFTKGDEQLRIPHNDLVKMSGISAEKVQSISERIDEKKILTLDGKKCYNGQDLAIEARSYKTKKGEERTFYVVRDTQSGDVVRLKDVVKRKPHGKKGNRGASKPSSLGNAGLSLKNKAQSLMMQHTIMGEVASSPMKAVNTVRSMQNIAKNLANGDPASAIARKLLDKVKELLSTSIKQV